MEKGYLSLILHAHLPFVRHPEHKIFLEENWLFEAITESYIPLITMMEGLIHDKIDFRLTISLSPTLLSMLTDPLLQNRYIARLNNLIELSSKELERTRSDPELHIVALHYHSKFSESRDLYVDKFQKNILHPLKLFHNKGNLEIITSSATHSFFPAMSSNRKAMRAQIEVAVEYFKELFGIRPRGFWLPECGYEPGLDSLLKEFGIDYFFVEAHGILHADPRPKFGVFAPLCCASSGIAAFGRDIQSSKQVWSAHGGYPGDPNYREFYRDIGYDLDYEYIKTHLHSDGTRVNTGIKYYRITGNDDEKKIYDIEAALQKAVEHADDFVTSRCAQIDSLNSYMGHPPIITAPFDAELFGHWWYEGPQWLDAVIRKCSSKQVNFRMITPSEYLDRSHNHQTAVLSPSTWGWEGYNDVWINKSNDWIYRHLHKSADQMVDLADRFPEAGGIVLRGLNQAARELLLAQSSDWAFIMKTGTMSQYAIKRTKTHLDNFFTIREGLLNGSLNENSLKKFEDANNIFPQIDYRVYV